MDYLTEDVDLHVLLEDFLNQFGAMGTYSHKPKAKRAVEKSCKTSLTLFLLEDGLVSFPKRLVFHNGLPSIPTSGDGVIKALVSEFVGKSASITY